MWNAIVDYFLYIANHLLEIIGSNFFKIYFIDIIFRVHNRIEIKTLSFWHFP